MTGENANTSAAPTPPENAKRELVLSALRSPELEECIISVADLHTSIAVQPAANAPVTAEKSDIAQAGVGCPMYVTQEKRRQNIQPHSVQNGYPGGCGTPRWSAAVASSPESSRPTDGPSVKK